MAPGDRSNSAEVRPLVRRGPRGKRQVPRPSLGPYRPQTASRTEGGGTRNVTYIGPTGPAVERPDPDGTGPINGWRPRSGKRALSRSPRPDDWPLCQRRPPSFSLLSLPFPCWARRTRSESRLASFTKKGKERKTGERSFRGGKGQAHDGKHTTEGNKEGRIRRLQGKPTSLGTRRKHRHKASLRKRNQRSREGNTGRELGKQAQPRFRSPARSLHQLTLQIWDPLEGLGGRVCSFSSSTDLTVGAPSPESPARVL